MGIGGWIAWSWLLVLLWKHTSTAGKAAIAAMAVGGLTQDTFGDLEVIRTLCAWCLLEPSDNSVVVKNTLEETS